MINVSIEDKKRFIKWLVRNKKGIKLRRVECEWILKYILNREEILEYVSFTDDVQHCPRSIVMSTNKSSGVGFRFYKGNLSSNDAEKAFHDIRMNPKEKLYFQINLPEKFLLPEYVAVHEENEFLFIDWSISKETEEIINAITSASNEALLKREIDKALDSEDEELFMKLSKELLKINSDKTISFSA